jgi:4-hydroxy-2-oxoglutarate aldolase
VNLQGVFPPITTPFDASGEVDPAALGRNITRWMKTGLSGVLVLGSNGEAPFLDDAEADRMVAAAREHVPRDRTLLVGTGRQSTRSTIAATVRAARAGADAVLVITPSYFKNQTNNDALLRHYRAVADASPVPVLIYNFTGVTGVNIPAAVTTMLASHPNIAGIKDSNGDVAQVGEVVAAAPERFRVLVGSAPSFCASLSVGASGGILALACVVPEPCVRLYELARSGRHDEALALQQQLTPLARAVTTQHGVPGLKAAMDLAGYVGGAPRSPLGHVSPAVIDTIREQLDALEIATVLS